MKERDMITAKSIKEIMTKDVVTVDSKDNIWEVERIFRINHLRHAPVCEDGELIGMVSLIDLRKNLPAENRDGMASDAAKALKAHMIMTNDPVTMQVGQSIRDAADIFMNNEFHAIPVMDGYDLVGIVSTTDLIKYLIDMVEDFDE